VIWEAQYGDFINTAQAMIDEFIASARAKWSQAPSLVLLLPHGNEGQGPDHSSGRPERFLQLSADINMRLAIPTTAAQYFHLLRRQALLLKTDPLPLIVFTPKGLLRHPLTASAPLDLAQKSWQPVLSEPDAPGKNGSRSRKVRRLLLCSGRIYVDLISSPLLAQAKDTRIARLEQLYPFPTDELCGLLESCPDVQEVIWVQEEPRNMGAWEYARPLLLDLNGANWRLVYVGRSPSSSPAEGSAAWYTLNQKAIIEAALSPEKKPAGETAAEVLVERG
jgi:2-oxoglutarate dehydrogenase E1 component